MDPIRFFRNRLIQLIPVLLGVSVLVFLMLRLIPGDPARIMLGTRATEERIAELHQEMGLDRPVWEQYFLFLGGALRGDLGTSIFARRPVVEVLSERMPVTLLLVAYAITLSLIITVPLAMAAALRRDRPADFAIRGGMILGLALPSFWLGLMLILVFSVQLKWFPISGVGEFPISWVWHLFLPALTLAVPVAAMLIRNLRSSVIDVLNAPYVEFARAKGLKSQTVLGKHVLRNALI
jgi:peptide/nickel transport system permease protein